ncbi:putative membrane spanning protein [Magnetofaba australis IT-1]|uniref:Putative membrane spanning protein n=1 Tax=Magnetofaba australis IT-1 TaxID=1434232 RepID=A0A1Y2K8Q3_9PROT|nr:putative membrane spanning protein [Magnetofaba australis IT-1]
MLIMTLALALWGYNHYLPNWDLADNILRAQRLYMEGERYGADVWGPNVPLVFMLHYPPTLVARWLQADPWLFNLLYFALWQWAAWLALSAALRQIVGAQLWLLAGFALLHVVTFQLLAGFDYAQRDHLFILLFLPALLHWHAREQGAPAAPASRWSAFAMAGVGCAIKPYYLLAPLLLLLISMLRQRSMATVWRAEERLFLLVTLSATCLPMLARPDWFDQFAQMRDLYGALSNPLSKIVNISWPYPAAWVALALLSETLIARPNRPLIRTLLLGAMGCYGILLLQQRGWLYHQVPSAMMTAFLSGAVALLLLQRWRETGFGWPQRIVALLCIVALYHYNPAISRWLASSASAQTVKQQLTPVAKALHPFIAPGSRVVYLSASAPLVMTLSGMLGAPAKHQPLPHLFIIGGIQRLKGQGRHHEARAYLDKVMAQWRKVLSQPHLDAIVVDRRITGHDTIFGEFDILAFFRQDPAMHRILSGFQQRDFPALGWSLLTPAQGAATGVDENTPLIFRAPAAP